MDALAAASDLRNKNAAMAMRRAGSMAAKHSNRAKKIIALPPVALERQCEVLTREQIEYVKSRHQNN
jgi:hypothetical protein